MALVFAEVVLLSVPMASTYTPKALLMNLSEAFDQAAFRRGKVQGRRFILRSFRPWWSYTPLRFILADTEQLHRKISEMSERIRQLEDALAIFQAGVSSERHPLLRDELLSIKFGPEVRRTVDEEHTRNTLSQTIDALGTLTVGDHGETKFIGRSGGTEVRHSRIYEGSCDVVDSSLITIRHYLWFVASKLLFVGLT